ncbi:hypothetical protein [Halomonas cerina]|uniref:Capsule polysaccharide biosynthesis protein n=1 Tax=Halomonas cerina TaxID=447424 RepID=A0A839V7D9_9GAMM|nr:hypothetical protein [Halomonas cerina]MBB3189439.1 hypothetical protein [Halomonas cerina]
MNILILSNGAPKYHHFFNEIAKKLSQDGHKIVFAVDSTYSVVENRISKVDFPFYNFSDFFKSDGCDFEVLDNYRDFNLNYALLSDFERSEVYGLWGRKRVEYFDNLKSSLLNFFSHIVDRESVDLVIYENVSNTFAYFCWFVCQKCDVKYMGFTPSRIPGRFWLTDDPFSEHKKVDETLDKINEGKIDIPQWLYSWSAEHISSIEEVTPDYMRFNNLGNISLMEKYFNKDKFKKLLFAIQSIKTDGRGSFQRVSPLKMSWLMFLRSYKRKKKAKKLTHYYETPVAGEKYFLYPLHFHPESSTSVLSGAYLNEYEVIRNMAFNLPEGARLYVKDHVSAFGLPSLKFYESLCRLPNVRLLSYSENTKELIKNSSAVATLTSTVGYEALLMGKKVFLFGSVFYQGHKNVVKVSDPKELHSLFGEACLSEPGDHDRDIFMYNVKFLCAYYMNTLKGSLNLMQGSRGARLLVEEVYPEFKMQLKTLFL